MRNTTGQVLGGTLFLSVFGYLWYGILFQSEQMSAHGYTRADYAGNSPAWYAGGALISLVIAAGLRRMIRLNRRAGLRAAGWAGLQAALLFGAPLVTYPFVFAPNHDPELYAVGLGHILLGWPAGAVLMSVLGAGSEAAAA